MTESLATMLAGASLTVLLAAFAVQISGHQKLALPIALIAFGCLSFVTVWRNYLPRQMAGLKQTIVERDQTIGSLKSDLAAQVKRAADDVANRERDIEQWTSSLSTIGTWLKQADIPFAPLVPQPAGTTPVRRAKALVDHVAEATKVSPNSTLSPQLLERLIRLIEARRQGSLKRPRYVVERSAQTELVAGRRGTYLVIKPIDPNSGQVVTFNERAYDWTDSRDSVRASLADIHSDILKDLERATPFEVFVLGHADALPFEASWKSGPEAGLQVLKRGGNAYNASPQPHIFGTTLRNDDLPNLRARQMVSLLGDLKIPRDLLILDNLPVSEIGTQFRSADIVLFLPW
jgi:hypothetical protein